MALSLLLLAVGGMVQSAVGFGVGVVAGPFLAVLRPDLVPTGLIVCGLLLALVLLVRDHRHIDWPGLGWALLGRLPGLLLGTWVVVVSPAPLIGIILSVSILATVAVNWSRPRISLTRQNLVLGGAAAGFTGTSAGIGGPPLAMVYQREEPTRTRATLSAFFAIGGAVSLVSLNVSDAIPAGVMRESILLSPAVLVGYFAARPLVGRMGQHHMRLIILVVAGAASLLLLIRSIWTIL